MKDSVYKQSLANTIYKQKLAFKESRAAYVQFNLKIFLAPNKIQTKT